VPHYRTLGLRVYCNEPLPRLVPVAEGGEVDVRVDLRGPTRGAADPTCLYGAERIVRPGPPALSVSTGWGGGGRHVRLRYAEARDHAEFVVGPGARRVWVTWSPEVSRQDVCTQLLGPVIACVLRLHGVLCLHAAVVEIDGRAVALAGRTGAGKSTTAAALIGQGARLLADDVAAIEANASGFRVHQGLASLRLYREAAERVLDVSGPLPPLWSNDIPSKEVVDVERDDHSCAEKGVPLAAIYVLTPRRITEPGVETIPVREAQLALAGHTSVRWVLDAAGRVDEFAALGRLASAVPTRRVHRPRGLDRLDEVCKAIEDDMRGLELPGIEARRGVAG
jgi:hypothetical protein